jgi:transcriptional regulator with GAF, ATPase, and Fis domain
MGGRGHVSPRLAGPWQLLELAGEGGAGEVWRARHAQTGTLAAVKLARDADVLLRESALVARLGRSWGPAVLDAGRADGAPYLALAWTDGAPLAPLDLRGDRGKAALRVAHAVGRGLEELHALGVRHGDVKPANIVLGEGTPRRDAPGERAATLIDLSLSGAAGDALGGTPRYTAPEVRAGGASGPEADLWALGIVLGEILDARVARSDDPASLVGSWEDDPSEAKRWACALTSRSPGARPAAGWIAARAARALRLAPDPEGQARARGERVRKAYLAARAHDIVPGATVDRAIAAPAREWLEEAVAWASRLAEGTHGRGSVGPMSAMQRARWLVALAGARAAAWPTREIEDGALAARLVGLARAGEPGGWTQRDVDAEATTRATAGRVAYAGASAVMLGRALARARPEPDALASAEERVADAGPDAADLALLLGEALARTGELGRASIALAGAGPRGAALRAEVARRRGDAVSALRLAEAAGAADVVARLAWDRGDLDGAERALGAASGSGAAEVRGLVAWSRGAYDEGARVVRDALAVESELGPRARLDGVLGMLEHARGDIAAARVAFARAADGAARAGAVVEEATYLTGEAAAAADDGAVGTALASATRAALLWERLGQRGQAARALLARAAALATVGATHAADEAAIDARRAAIASGDARAAAFARWPVVETRPRGDARARDEALAAQRELAAGADEDQVRAAARVLVWAPDAAAETAPVDAAARACSAPVQWEWWGARAEAWLAGRRDGAAADVLAALAQLLGAAAPLSSRGPALEAAARMAGELGDGPAARRFEQARREGARALREGVPPELVASLAAVAWARLDPPGAADGEVDLAPAQIGQLEGIARSLGVRDKLRPLLEQVLDVLVLWTGAERGLLLLPAPDGRLVPRAARNLARRDLQGEQLALSQGIARRALASREPVVATDAFSTLGDLHASVHALRLRSVLAVPLLAHGASVGVVYLDDRARKGAFGPKELAWVRLVASQAAMAIADARDQALLRRAARRAERARRRIAELLSEREAELHAARVELGASRDRARYEYEAIVGRSEAIRETLRLVDRVIPTDVPVLLVGESGTGKELLAQAIHAKGARGRRAFVSENCASVPETLLESTLFGHVRGSFTGATSTRAGLFDVADGGTFFLDEIGEMSPGMQAKLLRVLQDGEVRPVGGERARRVDVRVVAATHRDLEAMVKAGQFREDLFYRLNVVAIRVPPLRERRDDVPLLVAHLLEKHGRPLKVSRAAMERLCDFPWPGNVRQLENELRRAAVLADDRIDVEHLSPDVARGGPKAARGAGLDLRSRVDALEGELVREALGKTKGNQTKAAALLGLSRFGLQKMMQRLRIRT